MTRAASETNWVEFPGDLGLHLLFLLLGFQLFQQFIKAFANLVLQLFLSVRGHSPFVFGVMPCARVMRGVKALPADAGPAGGDREVR